GRLVQRHLAQLQLLPEGAGALGESLEALRAGLQRRDGGVHLADAALRPLGGRDRRRHQLLDPPRFLGVAREALEPLVGVLHPGQQAAAPLLELPPEGTKLREPRVEILDELAAPLDLRHGLRQPVGFGAYDLDGRLQLFDRRQLAAQTADRFRHAGQPRLGAGLALPHAGARRRWSGSPPRATGSALPCRSARRADRRCADWRRRGPDSRARTASPSAALRPAAWRGYRGAPRRPAAPPRAAR